MRGKALQVVFLVNLALRIFAAEAATDDSAFISPWWATECESVDATKGLFVFATFRKFPITYEVIDKIPERKLTFTIHGVTIGSERGYAVFPWSKLTRVQVEKVGGMHAAYALTISTDKGVVLNEQFGIVELFCLRKLEAALSKYARGREIGAPPPADIRLAPPRNEPGQ